MLMRKLLTFLTLLVLAYSVGWADTSTLTFTSACGGSGTSSDDGAVWAVTSDAAESTYDGTSGIHYGTGKAAVSYLQVKTSDISGTVTKIEANVRSKNGKLSITVGNTAVASNVSLTNTPTTYTYDNLSATAGDVTLRIDQTSATQAIYIKSIKVTYTSGTTTTYTVTAATGLSHGAISVLPTTAAENDPVTVTATPDAGYELASVTVTPSESGVTAPTATINGNTATFTMPASNVNVSATFTAKQTYDITVTGGSAEPSSAYEGQTVTLSPTFPDGKVVDWDATTVSPSTVTIDHSDYTFMMPGETVTVAFAFKDAPNEQTATLSQSIIYSTGDGASGYRTLSFTDANGKTWNAYAIKNQHSNATSSQHYLQLKKSTSSEQYYIQVPAYGTKITKLVMTVSSPDQPMTGKGSSATLLFSSSNTTTAAGTGVASATASSTSSTVTIDCSSLNLNTGYITTSAGVRIWDVTVYYTAVATYTVTATASPAGAGTFSFDPSDTNAASTNVTVTATPAAGYAFGSWSYTSGISSGDVVEDTNNHQILFEMPASDVALTATFSKLNFTLTRNSSNLSQGDVKITDASGNELSTQPTTAQMGDVIYFKPTTTWGYQVGTITVTNNTTSTAITPSETDGVYSFTMPAGNVTIAATFVAYHPTVKLGGLVNGSTWIEPTDAAHGVPLTYDSTNDKYTGRVFFTGNREESGVCDYFFVFEDNAAKYPSATGNYWITSVDGTAMTISLTGGSSSNFRIEPGIYDIELNGGRTSLKVTKVTPTLTFSPASGSVETGSSVSASSNLYDLLHAINSSITTNDVTDEVSGDNSTWAASYTFANGDVGSKTVYARSTYGNIAVTGSASYTVTPADNSNKYELVTSTSQMENGKKYLIVSVGSYKASQVTYNYEVAATGIANDLLGGEDITIASGNTITLSSSSAVVPYIMTLSDGKWSFTNSKTSENITFTDPTTKSGTVSTGETGTGFTLAIDSSTGVATLSLTNSKLNFNPNSAAGDPTKYRFTTYVNDQKPIKLFKQVAVGDYKITYEEVTGGTLSGATDANEGDLITVTATEIAGYACTSVTVTPTESGVAAPTVTDNHDGTFTFTMPASDVTVTPTWASTYPITYVAEPAAGGTVTGPANAVEAQTVTPVVTPENDYRLVSLTYEWNGGSPADITGSGNFDMPHYPTTVTATFEKKPFNITVVSPNGQVNGVPATAVSGQTVSFTITPVAGYTVTDVTATWVDGEDSGSVTVTESSGTYSFSMPAKNVTVTVGYFAGDEYELLTSLSDINYNDDYLIVAAADGASYTASGTAVHVLAGVSGDIGSKTDATLGTGGLLASTSSMTPVRFSEGSTSGTYKIYIAGNGYVTVTDKKLIVTSNVAQAADLTLTLDGNAMKITSDTEMLRYNTGSPRFCFYSSATGQIVRIFKLHDSNKVKKPTITGAVGQYIGLYNFIGTDQVTLACATDDATIKYKIGDATEWTTYSGEAFALPQTKLGGTVTVTAKATKTNMDDSDEVSAVFTCVKPEWHTKPCGDNWSCTDQEYDNPVFIYPNGSLANRNAYGKANIDFYYTLDGTTPTIESTKVPTPSSGDKFIFLDEDVPLSIIPVINNIAGDPVSGNITFVPAAPTATLAASTYDGDQQTRLSTTTKSSLNGTSWTTKIYYALVTTGTTPAAFAFNSSTGEVTSAGWTLYDPTTSPYIDILLANGAAQTLHAVTLTNFYGGEFTGQYSGASVNLNTTGTWVKSTETQVEYQLTAANLDVVFSPAGGTYLYAKDVTLKAQNAIGTLTLTYDITWANPDATHVSATGVTYSGAIKVDRDATITVHASDSRTGEGGSYTKTHVYKIGVQEPLFSPYPGEYPGAGDYYVLPDGDSEASIDVEIFDVTPNAKIYYTCSTNTLGDYTTTPATPTRSSTPYTAPIKLTAGQTYVFSAIAYVGDMASPVRTRAFTVRTNTDSGDYWYSVKEMNEDNSGVTKTFANPVQVIWMSTHSNDGTTPEYCFISDNSGYGLVFFRSGKDTPEAYQTYTKFNQGDWLPGKSITGTTAVWSNSYINELGGDANSRANVTAWPSVALNSRAIVPETTTCKAIRDGWTYGDGTPTSYTGSDFANFVDPDKNLFGHYVHLRKNTITNVAWLGSKRSGIITGELGTPLQYYDGFYLYSGFNGGVDYDQDFFNGVQNKGGTFDVYAVVQFYGKNTTNSTYSYAPFEIFPIAFDWIFPPIFHLEGDASASDMTNDTPERTIHAPSTVTLSCDTRGAVIMYKTSDMEDFEVYNGEDIAVNKSMTISTYSIHSTEHFDQLESKVRTLTINMGDIEQPVISPESCVKRIGDDAVTVSITCETSEVTIWYTTDGSDPADETNANRREYTGSFDVSQTTTVRAIASAKDGSETFYGMEAESKTYTFVKSNGIKYDLVTNASQLTEGSIYVIVNKANHMAMKRTQKADNRDGAGVAFVDDATKTQVFGNDDLAIFTLHKYGNGTDDWILHTANGSDNASIGYIYGNVSGTTNQLRTQFSNSSNEGKFEASIVIGGDDSDVDKAYTATISFPAASGGERWLRYNKQYGLFNTYSSTTGEPVFLYKKDAFPLANIEKKGVKGNEYTIADELIGVYANGTKLWAKDQGNVSISKRENTEGWEDYVATLYPNAKNAKEWDQSNWVCLEFGDTEKAASYVGKFIDPATVTGKYTDNVNYTIEVKSTPTCNNGDADFQATAELKGENATSVNIMTAPNFNDDYTGENGAQTTAAAGRTFFFVRPKVQEVVTVTNVTWDGSKFVIPQKNGPHNTADFNGAINVNWDLYEGTNKSTIVTQMTDLIQTKPDMEYTFIAVVSAPKSGSGAPRRAPKEISDATTTLVLHPTSISVPADPTGVDDVKVANREVKAVKYVDVVGRVSDRPFEGLNIIVTEYTDGSVETVKVLK